MKKFIRTKFVLATVVLGGLFVGAFSALNVQVTQAQAIQDCSANSIIKCGASSPADLIAKVKANNPADLQAIYTHFKLTPDKYDAFAKEAKMGMAMRNGDIVVDGQVVATNAWSIGRSEKSYSRAYKIDSTTYHRSNSTQVLRQDLPVMAWFDDKGQLEIAVLAACGNPMGGSVTKPSYKCQQLKQEKVSGQNNTYRYSTVAPATNGATISRVVYNFGDGSPEETRTNPEEVVTHTYEESGNYTAKVTMYAKLPGGREVAINGSGCAKKIKVAEVKEDQPAANAKWECTRLRATARNEQNSNSLTYTFRATGSSDNANLAYADFDFGDGETDEGVDVASSSSNNISVDHSFAEPGEYTANATLYFEPEEGSTAEGKDASDTCEVTFTIEEEEEEVVVTTATSKSEPEDDEPEELPAAGAAGVAGLFAGTSALGTLGYRWRARRKLAKVDSLIDSLKQP